MFCTWVFYYLAVVNDDGMTDVSCLISWQCMFISTQKAWPVIRIWELIVSARPENRVLEPSPAA